jgi:hypothetical protein
MLFGSSALALRAAVTGLPASFLLDPLRVAEAEPTAVDAAKAQFLVIALSDAGEPINCNGPGSYAAPDTMHHPLDPALQAAPLQLGPHTETAAQCWSTLPEWARNRAAFVQHATFAGQHGTIGSVLRLMGRVRNSEMVPSLLASHLGPVLKTLQNTPISVDGTATPVGIVANGVAVPSTSPSAWRELIGQYVALPEAMQKIRDTTTDRLYALLRKRGTRAQLRYLDALAKSSSDAKTLGQQVGSLLSAITDDENKGQLLAAAAVVKMNLAPVVCLRLNFGADNHADPDLKAEAARHIDALKALTQFFESLKSNGLEDKVTFASMGVFGRNFGVSDRHGRDHWGPHSTSIIIGKNVKPGLYGGLVARGGDFYATGFDSSTGAGVVDGGDVKFEDTLVAAGRTLGASVGLNAATLEKEMPGVKTLTGVLV